VGLDGLHFVVIDMFPQPGYLDEIEKLRKQVKGQSAPPKPKAVG
jgi:hypothetical protein